jgi:lysophospholipase L1-like esterase
MGELNKSNCNPISPLSPTFNWKFMLLASLLPILGLVMVDIALRIVGLVPPEDPLVLYSRTYEQGFSPYVKRDDGFLEITPDWVNEESVLAFEQGKRAGRYFLYPGFRQSRIAENKSSNTIRIFALGGSTTYGMFVGAKDAFPAILEKRLCSVFPEYRVEVVNLGCPGFPSSRVTNLLDTMLGLDPDLIIVYSGHNEMLKGYTDDVLRLSPSSHMRRLVLSTSTVCRWINYAISCLRGSQEPEIVAEEIAALEAGKILVYDPLTLPAHQCRLPNDELLNSVAANYSTNVRGMISRTHSARVPILFVLPVSNLLVPPAMPHYSKEFEKLITLQSVVFSSRQGLPDKVKLEKVVSELDATAELSPQNAMVQYLRGIAFLFLGQKKEALSELQESCDFDFFMMHRITSRLELGMIEAVESRGGSWVDLRQTFRNELNFGSTQKLFVDHCHPTRGGHRLIAEQVLPMVIDLLNIKQLAGKMFRGDN